MYLYLSRSLLSLSLALTLALALALAVALACSRCRSRFLSLSHSRSCARSRPRSPPRIFIPADEEECSECVRSPQSRQKRLMLYSQDCVICVQKHESNCILWIL